MEDDNLESGLDAVDETEEVSPEEEESELSPLEIARRYRQADVRRTEAAAELQRQLKAARDVLLQQPTEMSRSDKLLGIASTLLAPGPVGRAGTLGESLGSLGKYLTGVSAAEREAKQEQAKALAQFDLQSAREAARAAEAERRELATLASKYISKPRQNLQADAQKIIDLQSIIDNPDPKIPQAAKDAAKRQIDAIGKQTDPADRSVLGQIVRARTMLKSNNPEEVKAAEAFLAKYSTSGRPPVTVSQARKDKMIRRAKEFLATVDPKERVAAFANPYPNERQQKIKDAVRLAEQPTYEEVATSGGFSSEPIPDEDEG